MKWLHALFNIKHVHCYSEKNRIGVMVCHVCGKWEPKITDPDY